MRPELAPQSLPTAFRPDRLDVLAGLADHFWAAGRRELVRALLPDPLVRDRDVVDVGCGSGATLVELRQRGARVTGVDSLSEAVQRSRVACPAANVWLASTDALPLPDAVADGMTLLDVLEHVEETPTLAEARRVLRSNGWLLVTVPAGSWLWSFRDEDAGHLRRYSRARLERALLDAGFVVDRFARYQCALLPVAAASRLLGRRSRAWRDREDRGVGRLNAPLSALNRLEGRLAAHVTLPWGTSLAVLARPR